MKRSIVTAALGLRACHHGRRPAQDICVTSTCRRPIWSLPKYPRRGRGRARCGDRHAPPISLKVDCPASTSPGSICPRDFPRGTAQQTKLAGHASTVPSSTRHGCLEADLTGASLKGANLSPRRWFAPVSTAPISRALASLPISLVQASSEPRSQRQIWAPISQPIDGPDARDSESANLKG